MANFEWTCVHCDRVQTAGDDNSESFYNHINIGKPTEGHLGCTYLAIRCLNSQCGKTSFKFHIHADIVKNGYWSSDLTQVIFADWLLPRGTSKPQPDYIPLPIRSDYEEACLVRTLSPKASATLSRRCLQGMIRDFAGISKNTLDAEIRALHLALDDGSAPRAISVESVQAIDHVRKIGNIGAHMEKDINVIIDVDPDEALALIELIELLMREWYVDRHNRQQRLASVEAIRLQKDQAKLAGNEPPAALPLSASSKETKV